MPISEAHVGRTYPPTQPYTVTGVKIAEFARALGDDNAAYAGGTPQAPPTFAAVLAADAWGPLFADEELDLRLDQTLHTDQKFAWHRPLRAGDDVTATLTIDKVRTRANTAFVTISVLLATTAGESLCTASSTLLHTWPVENEEEA
ncbi:FAS1-like dehydratase domain-containing protein [Nigerium massiliense]|uniref:FAS1-like dehydratase domain-containing protein n=1 Tax=Nigerium massiliense TaxID=1522317 RepID=UPI00058EAD21|nr:MaoC family dehydratase N-terminal domain-containing protein [Nigerium massiliense]